MKKTTKARVGSIAFASAIAIGCASNTPQTSSSSNWAHCSSIADCAAVPNAAACEQGYCVDSSGVRIPEPSSGAGGAANAGGAAAGGSPQGGGAAAVGGAGGHVPELDTGGTVGIGAGGTAIAVDRICSAIESGDGSVVPSLLPNAICELRASDYDRSCSKDDDCGAVGVGNACSIPCEVKCPSVAISVAGLPKYTQDFGHTPLAVCPDVLCGCPCVGTPACVNGTCVLGKCGAPREAGVVDSGK
jgi:hypothetical protein